MNYQNLKHSAYVVLLDRMVVKILFVADLDKECRVLKHDGTKDTIPFETIRAYATLQDVKEFESKLKLYPDYNLKLKSMNKELIKQDDYVSLIDGMIVKIIELFPSEVRILTHYGKLDIINYGAVVRHAVKGEIDLFNQLLISKQSKSKQTMKLVELKEGRGIIGATINLNLAQCQKLKQLHTKVSNQLESENLRIGLLPETAVHKDAIEEKINARILLFEDLNKFLSLFENFQHPDDEDLWQDPKDDFDGKKY